MSAVVTFFPRKRLGHRSSNDTLASSASTWSPLNTRTPSIRSTSISIAPSTPHFWALSRRSSFRVDRDVEFEQACLIQFTPRIAQHLSARDILNLSSTCKQCNCLRSSLEFHRHLTSNGWDIGTLVRRAENANGRSWMFLARSAIDKGDILSKYASLPKEGGEKASATDEKAVENFMRVLVDVATEHHNHNFTKLTSLANALQMSLIQFVTAIQAHDWKTRYRKTFVIAALSNAQPSDPDAESDLEGLADTLDFQTSKPPILLVATFANFLHAYGCISSTTISPNMLAYIDYDPPHLCSPHGTSLPGLRQAIERYKLSTAANGFYHKIGGTVTSVNIAFEPGKVKSKSGIPFTEKDRLTLMATCTTGDVNPSRQMEGFVDLKTGVAKLKDTSGGIIYELWTTPWGIAGQEIQGEGKHLGYYILYWV